MVVLHIDLILLTQHTALSLLVLNAKAALGDTPVKLINQSFQIRHPRAAAQHLALTISLQEELLCLINAP